eukprot:g28763.t1
MLFLRRVSTVQEETLGEDQLYQPSAGDEKEYDAESPCSSQYSDVSVGSMDSTVASVSDLADDESSWDVESPGTRTLDMEEFCDLAIAACKPGSGEVPYFIQLGAARVPVRSSAISDAVSPWALLGRRGGGGGIEQGVLDFLNAHSPDLFVEGWDGLFIWPREIPRVEPRGTEKPRKATDGGHRCVGVLLRGEALSVSQRPGGPVADLRPAAFQAFALGLPHH